jgi:hypothetical protein
MSFKNTNDDQAWCLFAAAALSGLNSRVNPLGSPPSANVGTAATQADALLEKFQERQASSRFERDR